MKVEIMFVRITDDFIFFDTTRNTVMLDKEKRNAITRFNTTGMKDGLKEFISSYTEQLFDVFEKANWTKTYRYKSVDGLIIPFPEATIYERKDVLSLIIRGGRFNGSLIGNRT